MIWANLKGYVEQRNLHFRKTSVETLIDEGIENIDEREWSACCKHIREMEQECRKRDVAEEEEIDRVIIFVDSDSDVSDNEGTATASEDDKSTDTADETKLFLYSEFEIMK